MAVHSCRLPDQSVDCEMLLMLFTSRARCSNAHHGTPAELLTAAEC